MKPLVKLLFAAALSLSASACSPTTDSTTTTAVDPATAANEAKADSMLAGDAATTAGANGQADVDKLDAAAEKAAGTSAPADNTTTTTTPAPGAARQ